MGVDSPNTAQLPLQLGRVLKAPLKPHQKIVIISTYLLPRYLYILQAPNISAKTLLSADRSVRSAIRQALHLPQHCTNSFIHAPLKFGGLGITSFMTKIPQIIFKRLTSMREERDELSVSLSASIFYQRTMEKLRDMLNDTGVGNNAECNFWRTSLERSVSGNGLSAVGSLSGGSSWVYSPPGYWTGREYVSAVLLRGNLLPVSGGVHNPSGSRFCRHGCERTESLSHVLQKCPATHFERIKRHDHIVRKFAECARAKGWSATVEPRFRGADGRLLKPDLLLVTEERVIVADVAVHWEGPEPLDVAARDKVLKYSDPAIRTSLATQYPERAITVLPFILGARGGWCPANDVICDMISIPAYKRRDFVLSVLKGGALIHRAHSARA